MTCLGSISMMVSEANQRSPNGKRRLKLTEWGICGNLIVWHMLKKRDIMLDDPN